jgi:predicted dienelactone hydrolase
MPLRTQQLEIRHIEILEALKAFKTLVQGNKDVLGNSQDYLAWDSWTDQVNTDTIIFDGHSFGGCTGVSPLFAIIILSKLTQYPDTPLNIADP